MEGRPLEDAELVERAKRGEVEAFPELVGRYQEVAFRTAYLILGSASEAEDAAQEAFVKAYHALGRFRAGAPFRPWLLQIVANEARNRRKATGRRAGLALRAAEGGPAGGAALPRTFDFARRRRLLDVGGGTGSWSIAVTRACPHLEATVFELPTVAEVARKRIAAAGLTSRIGVVVGDAMTGALPSGFDVFLVANLIHYWSPDENRALLRRVRSAAATGASPLLADFWTDPTHTQPVQAALMAGEFAVLLRNGDVYSVEELRGWLEDTGWRFIQHAPLVGPQSLVVAEAG